jgi:hypothetical protein
MIIYDVGGPGDLAAMCFLRESWALRGSLIFRDFHGYVGLRYVITAAPFSAFARGMITTCSRGRSPFTLRRWIAANFSSSPVITNHQLKPPLHLDPSLKALLKDVDMSLLKHKNAPPHKLLEILFEESDMTADSKRAEPDEEDLELGRKSPAADFGSQKIGAVVLPSQLSKSINQLIQG